MSIQLRQIALVARELEPVIQDLTAILGINRCYVDPGVGVFGLENTLMPVGRNFLEVVAPVEENTAGGRYLDRRQGDGGYMVITQADSRETQQQVRQNALDNGVRVAHEVQRGDWHLCQLHPGDLKAAFFEIESDGQNDFNGFWHPVGGLGWEDKVKQDVTVDFTAVELQGPDPVELAELWGKVAGLPVARDGEVLNMQLNNATLRFVEATDGRGPGLGGVDLAVADRAAILAEADKRGAYVDDHQVDICGVRWYLHDV
ncbi:MAG: VOC family protein [Pseudomonadales bacterium]